MAAEETVYGPVQWSLEFVTVTIVFSAFAAYLAELTTPERAEKSAIGRFLRCLATGIARFSKRRVTHSNMALTALGVLTCLVALNQLEDHIGIFGVLMAHPVWTGLLTGVLLSALTFMAGAASSSGLDGPGRGRPAGERTSFMGLAAALFALGLIARTGGGSSALSMYLMGLAAAAAAVCLVAGAQSIARDREDEHGGG